MEPYFRNNYGSYNNKYFAANGGKRMNFISQNYPHNNLNFSNMNQNLNSHNQLKKNISEITKLNYNTETSNTNDFNQNINEIIKLDHKLIESTTEDNEHPLRELLKGVKGVGWFSSRFSQFPQEIYIQFSQPVLLRQINMIIHEKNIPAQIKFYTYFPENNNEIIRNYHNVPYKYIGFIKMDTNERSQFRARESRKVYVNTKSLFLKIELGRNYINEYNIFNQVGLMNLDFLGIYLPPLGNNFKKNQFILKHAIRKDNINSISDQALEDICGAELKDLKEKMNYNIKMENYIECKQIKMKLDKIRMYGRQIYDLENQKKLAVNNEDFDKAIDLKNLVDKMKVNLKTVINCNPNNNFNDIENQIIGNNKYSQIGLNKNANNLTTINNLNNNNDSLFNNNNTNSNILNTTNELNQNINESIYSNSNDNMNNQLNQSGTKYLLNTNYSNNHHQRIKSNEENFISYDDTILPAVLKKLTNEPKNEEDELGSVDKGELEPISTNILKEFKLISDVIGELELRKIFSKQILWKEEGLNNILNKINDVLDYNVSSEINNKNDNNKTDITNQIITSIMKLSMILIEEKHPSVIIKTLEILKELFEYIKKHGTKLNIDLNITDSVLTKIKRKLGDANRKVRSKAVSLYCYMLTLDFCDYNNLISELLEEELKHYDSKYIPKSPNLIIGKLDIFNSVFDEFYEAINSKRTSLETFPSNLVIDYLIMNVSNNKSEVRKLCRLIISKYIRIFGANKIKKKLEKIEERELLKLINEIPSLEAYFPKINKANINNYSLSQLNGSNASNNSKGKNKNKEKNIRKIGDRRKGKNSTTKKITESNTSNNTNNNSSENEQNKENEEQKRGNEKKSSRSKIKNKSHDFCDYCQRKMKKEEIIENHWVTDCPMFIKCEKCNMNVEVKFFNPHKINECKYKKDFKECRTCHEALSKEEYENHLRNKCGIKHGYIKCPLCHGDVQDNNIGFFQHLVKDGCPSNKKMNK